jgi:SAM-dependent methyltransferase
VSARAPAPASRPALPGHRWSSAIGTVLEKHGYLSEPEVLLATPDRHDAIVAALEDGSPAIVEGPLTDPLLERFGLEARPASPHGALTVTDKELRAGCERFGDAVGGRVDTGVWRSTPREPETHWPNTGFTVAPETALAWAEPGWDVQAWGGARKRDVLAVWIAPDGERWPAIVRSGSVVACCFGLFSFLAQAHTTPPARGADTNHGPRTEGLEAVLLALIDGCLARAGMPRARVLPWPAGATWVLSVRHDVDRRQPAAEIRAIVERHGRLGTSATWYWRASQLRGRGAAAAIRAVADADHHEVAHHTEQLYRADGADERTRIERAAGRHVLGTSAHGDPRCFRWQGAPNVLHAADNGYAYTEFLSHAHLLPHRFVAPAGDGSVAVRDVICLPHHDSFDRGTGPGETHREQLAPTVERFRRNGGLLQILNHPDIHADELFSWLAELPREGRLDWTAGEAAVWWRRTHVAGAVELRREPDGRIGVTSREPVRGLVIELRHPDGRLAYFRVDRTPGHIDPAQPGAPTPATLGDPAEWRRTPHDRWTHEIAPEFTRLTEHEAERQGLDPASPRARSTVRTNSELVPDRAHTLLRLLAALAGDGHGRIAGCDVLDVACGVGSLTAYLALLGAASVVGIDVREDRIAAALGVRDALALARLDFRADDMRTLRTVEDASIDVVIASNAIAYSGDADAAVVAIARVLRPDGLVLVHQPLKWRLREPLTKGPPLHLLPARAAAAIARATGWPHSHDRVRFLSARETRRLLRRAGFTDLRTGAVRRGYLLRGPAAVLAGSYAVVGRRAG